MVMGPPANTDVGLIPGLGIYTLEEETVTRFSILAWKISQTEEHGVTKSQTQLSNQVQHER